MPTNKGAFKIFRLFEIDVYIHCSWFLAFYLLPRIWQRDYSNYGWNVLEVLGLFLIVLTHEFGHQLACRQVGGKTHDIVLWPLGGVAYVTPPERPGAQLWSIAAGPLVNVVLVPVLSVVVSVSSHLQWYDSHLDLYSFLHNIWVINLGLLIFNMMPVYPLDGGQILRSLLWFPFGRANSLLVTSIIGFIGVAGLFLAAGLMYFSPTYKINAIYLGAVTAFILMNCWGGLRHAQVLGGIAKLPRREGFACPSCQAAPPLGELWRCGKCGRQFDTFLTQGVCPHCGVQYSATQCLDCGAANPAGVWMKSSPANN